MSVYLAQTGMANMFLTEKPDITHFRTVYKRDAPSLTRSIEIPFDKQSPRPGDTLISTLPQTGDYIDGVTLKLKLPSLVPKSSDWIFPGTQTGTMYGFDSTGNQLFSLNVNGNPVTNSNNWYVSSYFNVSNVSTGTEHTAIVTNDGRLFMFGSNGYGQLGLGDTVDRYIPTQVTFFNDNVKSASCGDFHTAVVTKDGNLYTFGDSTTGKLGLGGVINFYSSNLPSNLDWRSVASNKNNSSVVAVAYGSDKAAYSTDGGVTWTSSTLPSVANWYFVSANYLYGSYLAVAYGSNKAAYSTDNGVTWTPSTLPFVENWSSVTSWVKTPSTGDSYVAVAYGSDKAAYTTNGGVTWTPSTLPFVENWSSVTSSGNTGQNIVAVAYGSNKAAYSTDGGVTWTSSTLPSVANWSSVTSNDYDFYLAVAYGSNKAAYSTDGGVTWTSSTLPFTSNWKCISFVGILSEQLDYLVKNPFRFNFIAISDNTSLAACSIDGITWSTVALTNFITQPTWQAVILSMDFFTKNTQRIVAISNNVSIVSYSGFVNSKNPTRVTFFNSNVASVSCGNSHTMIVTNNGDLFATGDNARGQLGTGYPFSIYYIDTPTRVTFFNSDVSFVSCGRDYSSVITSDKNLYVFGYNGYGQLGLGDNADRPTPTRVTFFNSNVYSVSSSKGWQTSVITTDNNLFTSGRNNYGQLGLGDTVNRRTPTQVTFFNSNVAFVSTGYEYNSVITTSGDLFTFGRNNYRQLGLGDNVNRLTPTRVTFFNSNVAFVSCGRYYTCAITNDQYIFTFGATYSSIQNPIVRINLNFVSLSTSNNKFNFSYISNTNYVVFSSSKIAQLFGFIYNPIKLFGGYVKFLTNSTSDTFSGQVTFQESGWLSGNVQYFNNSYIDDISSKFIKNTSLYIGKQIVQEFDSKFIRLKKEISTSYKNYPLMSFLEGNTNVVDFERIYYYKIPFIKIPFHALERQDVQIYIETNPFNYFDFNVSLIIDYITIDSKLPSSYLLKVPQMTLFSGTIKNPLSQMFIDGGEMKLNNENFFDSDSSNVSSFENHFNVSKSSKSFVLDGTINMSRIIDQKISVSNVYAETINFMKIENGLSGILFDTQKNKFQSLTGNVYTPQNVTPPVMTYLFDYIPLTASNVITIYSMRRVSSGYNGSIVRIYNGTIEEDFYTDEKQSFLKTSYGTDYSTWVGQGTGKVVKWYDQSGNGNHAYQNDDSLRPTISIQDGKYCISIENSNIPHVSAYQWMNITNKIQAQQFVLYHYPYLFNFRGFVFGFQNSDYGFKINQLSDTRYRSIGTSPGDFATGTDQGYSQSNWVQFPGSTNVKWWNDENFGQTSNKQNYTVTGDKWNVITTFAETLPSYSNPVLDGGFSLLGRSQFGNPDQSYNGKLFEVGFFSGTSLSSEHDEYYANKLS